MDDLARRAAGVVTEALEDGRDVAEFLAQALCYVAAKEGSTEEVLRNRWLLGGRARPQPHGGNRGPVRRRPGRVPHGRTRKSD